MTITQGHRFFLHVSIPDHLPRKVEVIDHIFAGLDPRCDVVLIDKKIKNRHFLFERIGPVLSVKVLIADSASFLNNSPMEKDRAYVVDQGDVIEVGKATITISSMYGDMVSVPERSRLVQFPSLDELTPETDLELKEIPLEEERLSPKKVIRTKKHSPWLIHFKILALILDFFLGYALMMIFGSVIILPVQLIVVFYLLRILSGLIFGRTIGEILVGLYSDRYSLQTRVGPLFFISFLELKSEKLPFRFMRKWGFLFVLFLCVSSPFFLPGSSLIQVTSAKSKAPLLKALQTFSVSGHSFEWSLGLKADISVQYYLLPVFQKEKKASLSLFNIHSKKELHFKEVKTFSENELKKTIKYANPLTKLFSKKLTLKEEIKNVLTLSPLSLSSTLENHGPFFGGSILLKKEILSLLNFNQDVLIDEMGSSLPLLILSDGTKELVLLFTEDQMLAFSLTGPKPYDHGLHEAFHHTILTQFYWETDESLRESSEESDILRPLDEIKHGNITALLTYYSNEAKKLSKSNVINQSFGVLYLENKKSILSSVLSRLDSASRDEIVAKSIREIKNFLNDEGKKSNTSNDRKTSDGKNVRKNSRPSKRTLQIQTRARR
jgi:hypothetical protein